MLKRLVVGSRFEALLRRLLERPQLVFLNSGQYWEDRYRSKGDSGSGSYGRLALFKAAVLNDFVLSNGVRTVLEFGCGDGNQLELSRYPSYVGIDVAPEAVSLCRRRFEDDKSKQFFVVGEREHLAAELSISLDVIYHLVEDAVYEEYMQRLFEAASRYVIIYSSNFPDSRELAASHVRHRKFTDWVAAKAQEFDLVNVVRNEYPYDPLDEQCTSLADFYFFVRRNR